MQKTGAAAAKRYQSLYIAIIKAAKYPKQQDSECTEPVKKQRQSICICQRQGAAEAGSRQIIKGCKEHFPGDSGTKSWQTVCMQGAGKVLEKRVFLKRVHGFFEFVHR